MVGPGSDTEYRVVRGGTPDVSRVESFLRRVFYPREPLCAALGLTSGPADRADMPALRDLHAGWSLLAQQTSDGALVGACICNVAGPGVHEHQQQEFKDERMTEIWRVVGGARAASGVGARRALDVSLIAVDPALRGSGLGADLLRRAAAIARSEAGAELLTAVCTSAYSARLSERLGMRCLYSQPYSEVSLTKMPPEPHTHVSVYALDLRQADG